MKAYIVNKAALEHNLGILQKKAGDTVIWAVVKGDGYGLGCVALAQVLSQHGIGYFALTQPEEALKLRQAGFDQAELLMMSCTSCRQTIEMLLQQNVILTVGTIEEAKIIDEIALQNNLAARVHLKVDTGMGRFGFLPSQSEQILQVYQQFPNVQVAGIYTHFYDSSLEKPTNAQYQQFCQVVEAIRSQNVDPGMVHCCNSSAFWKYPHMHCDAVRIGSGLLGRLTLSQPTGLERIGYCSARLEQVRMLPKGHPVGYGAGYVTKAPTRIGVVDVGYINGFSVERGYDVWRPVDCLRGIARYAKALLTKKALYVRVNGKNCRVLGHVGMVNLVVDVTNCPCQTGDEVSVEINPLSVRNMDIQFQ